MKKFLTPALPLLMFLAFIISCSKDGSDYIPQPTPRPNPAAIRFALDSLTLPSNGDRYYALVSIKKENGQVVFDNKKLPIESASKPMTAKLPLVAGSYLLTSLLIVNDSNVAQFASPVRNSSKAASVARPLVIDFEQLSTDTATLPVEVVGIQAADTEEAFGYPANAFNRKQTPDPVAHSFTIQVRTEILVGTVLYDSIPSSLMIRSWDSAQQLSVSFHSLKAGNNEFTLSKSKVKYELTIEKWGLSEKFIIPATAFEDGKLYKLSGTKPFKPLRSEITSILVNGVYKADSKNTYLYNGNGSLDEIQYQRKNADGTPFLEFYDKFEYSGNRLQYIIRFKPDGEIIQHLTFTYDASGKVSTIREVNEAGETNASVEYFSIAGREESKIHYTYPSKPITMDYYKVYVNGNLMEGNSVTSHHNTEISRYSYDTNINPYSQMNWPDIYLSRQSKNNVTYQQSQYQNSFPQFVPYGFTYSYDTEGYPKELVKQYRTYLTGQHAYTAKTVYTY